MPERETRLQSKPPKTSSLVFLCAFAALGSVIITPSLPTISRYFSVSDPSTQLTVTLFLLGYALGQLVYGPIANRLGRVLTLHIGLMLAVLGTVFSILSSPFESFGLLLFGRFIEAIGCSVGLVVSFMMVNDYYYPQQAKKIFAIFMVALAIVPGLGVFVGGLISQYLNWESCFYFLLIYNVVLFFLSFLLTETLQERDRNALHLKNIVINYAKVAVNRNVLVFGSLVGCSVALIYVFSAEGPFIVIKLLGFSAGAYGVLAVIPPMGVLISAFFIMRFFSLFTDKQWLVGALLLDIVAVLSMFILFMFHVINIYSLIIPVFLVFFAHTFIATIGCAFFVSTLKDKANGTSFSNFIMMGVAVLATYSLTLIHSLNPIIMPLLYLVLVILIFLLLFFGKGEFN